MVKYATYMKMFRIDYRIITSLMEFANLRPNPIGLFTGKIQNGRHEITNVIISALIIEIETRIFLRIKEYNATNDTFI